MTKVYLVKSVRATKQGLVYETVENVFTNVKKAKVYIEWIQKSGLQTKFSYLVIRYKIDEWNIDTKDYNKLPF